MVFSEYTFYPKNRVVVNLNAVFILFLNYTFVFFLFRASEFVLFLFYSRFFFLISESDLTGLSHVGKYVIFFKTSKYLKKTI